MSDVNHATVSLKGAGKDSLWIVLNGSADEMVQQIKDIFKFPEDQIEGLDPVELMVNADSTLKTLTTVGHVLGGKVIVNPERDETGGWHGEAEKASAQDPHGDAWERAGAANTEAQAPEATEAESAPEEPAQAAHPHQAVIDQLKVAPSIDALKEIWAKHSDTFKDPDVIGAYKERGAELKKAQ